MRSFHKLKWTESFLRKDGLKILWGVHRTLEGRALGFNQNVPSALNKGGVCGACASQLVRP